MNFPQSRKFYQNLDRRGFSLVVTMVMMSLLVVLALGLMSLSTVSLRKVGRERIEQQARSNARLALQLALGELQRLAGPDSRVTAPSSIIAGEEGQQHLTGVWEGWKWDGEGRAPDWKQEKEKRFKGWLVSGKRDGEHLLQSYAETAPPGETITLVGKNEEAGSEVRAPLVTTSNQDGRETGGFAWAAFDASQKVDVSVSPEKEGDSFSRGIDRLSSAHEPGFHAVSTNNWKPLAEKKDKRSSLLTREQSRLIGLTPSDISFHDMASGTYGILADVAKGGLAKDLSRLFERDSLPSDYRSRFIYSDRDSPLAPPPARFSGANRLPSPDPSWALLHSHYRTYKKIADSSSPKIAATIDQIAARPDAKTSLTQEQILREPAFNQQQIAPVIAKAQFVFSLTFGVNDALKNMWANGSARSVPISLRDTYVTWLVIDPVITLWNPYNVPIEFTGATVELHRIPMAFRLHKNGKALSEKFTRLIDAHTKADFKSRHNRFYLLKLLPDQGGMVIQPGEHIVFTGHQWTRHGGHNYNLGGLEMRPGFNPPAGDQSSNKIGGVTTQNLFVDPVSGEHSGKDYEKSIRTVAVKGGDQIQIEVRPERAGVDSFAEAGGKEVTGFLKYYLGTQPSERKLIGGIELDYGSKEKDLLPEYDVHDLPTIVVNSAIPQGMPASTGNLDAEDVGAAAALRWKEPFLIATFQQKTERDSMFPSRSWVNNGPANLYSSAGIDDEEDFAHQQYEFKWEPMMDWPPDSPTIEISNERNRGYGGSGIYAQSGSEFATFSTLPIQPARSIGQLSHAPLNVGGQLPLTTRVVGNSYAPPLLPADRLQHGVGDRTYLDHSYLANNALFDSWFFSSLADQPALDGAEARTTRSLLEGFFRNEERLPNSRFLPYLGGRKVEDVIQEIEDEKNGYERVAEHLLIESPFNVNSTRVAAWESLLASNFGADAPLTEGRLDQGDGVPVLRNLPAIESSGAGELEKWNGYRRLNEEQIQDLAKEIVAEVKNRGPFQSLSEFINRQPGGDDEKAKYGAVEAAISRAQLNREVLEPQYDFESNSGLNPRAATGNTADGAPGVISQIDLLTPLLPQLTVRGDTFTIRAYGEASDLDGIKVRVWCEATVQRLPEYVIKHADIPSAEPTSQVNRIFGRQFSISSFRWLTPGEI